MASKNQGSFQLKEKNETGGRKEKRLRGNKQEEEQSVGEMAGQI